MYFSDVVVEEFFELEDTIKSGYFKKIFVLLLTGSTLIEYYPQKLQYVLCLPKQPGISSQQKISICATYVYSVR